MAGGTSGGELSLGYFSAAFLYVGIGDRAASLQVGLENPLESSQPADVDRKDVSTLIWGVVLSPASLLKQCGCGLLVRAKRPLSPDQGP